MYEEFDENCIGDNGKTLPKGGPGGLRRELFELPRGCFELAGALSDSGGVLGVLRRPPRDALGSLGGLSGSSRDPPGTPLGPLKASFLSSVATSEAFWEEVST